MSDTAQAPGTGDDGPQQDNVETLPRGNYQERPYGILSVLVEDIKGLKAGRRKGRTLFNQDLKENMQDKFQGAWKYLAEYAEKLDDNAPNKERINNFAAAIQDVELDLLGESNKKIRGSIPTKRVTEALERINQIREDLLNTFEGRVEYSKEDSQPVIDRFLSNENGFSGTKGFITSLLGYELGKKFEMDADRRKEIAAQAVNQALESQKFNVDPETGFVTRRIETRPLFNQDAYDQLVEFYRERTS